MLDNTVLPTNLADCPCRGKTLERLLRPAVLTVLAAGEQYGYKLVKHLAAMPVYAGHNPHAAGVYRCLKLMEQEGLVISSWQPSADGPAKRAYALTPTGLACLSSWLDTLQEYRRVIDGLLLAGHAALSGVPAQDGCCCEAE